MLHGLEYKFVTVTGNGSVYDVKQGKHKKGFAFYYTVNGANKKRKVITGKDEEEIREKVKKFLDELEKDCEMKAMASKAEGLTFRMVSAEWFEIYKERRNDKNNPISYSSVESREASLKRLNEVLGDVLITDITQEMAESAVDKCSKKKNGTFYSESHVSKLEQVLHLVMEYAWENKYCTHGLKRIRLNEKLTKPNADDRFLDKSQIKIIKEIVEKNPRYSIIVELLAKTGMRQEEMFALETTDFVVQKDNRVALSITKTVVENEKHEYGMVERVKRLNSKRTIYITYDLYERVMAYHKFIIENESGMDKYNRKVNKTENVIFVNQDKCYPNKRTFARNFKDYLKRNGGEEFDFNVTLHMFRHSYASHMAEKTTAEKVAKVLGDSRETVFKNYFSLTEKDKDDIAEASDSIYEDVF